MPALDVQSAPSQVFFEKTLLICVLLATSTGLVRILVASALSPRCESTGRRILATKRLHSGQYQGVVEHRMCETDLRRLDSRCIRRCHSRGFGSAVIGRTGLGTRGRHCEAEFCIWMQRAEKGCDEALLSVLSCLYTSL